MKAVIVTNTTIERYPNTVEDSSQPWTMGKFDCPVCHKSAKQIASNKTGSVQCSVCSLLYHPPCANLEEGKLDMIYKCVEMGMNTEQSLVLHCV